MQIQVANLHKTYFDGVGHHLHILRGLTFEASAGSTISIIGASGTGKSTFLHILGALDNADEGSIQIEGTELSSLNRDQTAVFRNQFFGIIFQFHQLLHDFSALDNVMMPLLINGRSAGSAKRKAKEVLAEVGLGKRLSHKPNQLSGGEQQRVAIARAIVNSPKILLADEPTGNLDQETGDQVFNLILKLNKEYGITLIMITHNPLLASTLQHQYRMENGLLNLINN